jgi:iron complex outermembrane receptor protein
MRRASVLAAFAMLCLFAAPLHAQSGTIRGKVADSTGAALARATVSVEGTALHVQSDEQGQYQLTGVPAGARTVSARLIGYQPQSAVVTVGSGPVTHDFTLVAQAVSLAGIDVVVGSRARHAAADELAVPVDVYQAEDLAHQGTTETAGILQALSPSVNFPRQSVTDATDIVRPFTLRGLSPDHTLVLMNGWRMHQTAVVNTFAYGTGAGSSGVDLNTIPSSAIDRIEVLRDGASAQYGSDAIAGVVNLVPRHGAFAPFMTVETGRYLVSDYPDDGNTVNVSGGWGFGIGRGSLALFGEVLNREPTNRAWADPYDDSGTGLTDSVNSKGQVVVKNSGVPQPNHHWGDGLEQDIMTLANLRLPVGEAGHGEFYAFGGVTVRHGNGEGYRRYASSERNWPQIYPLGYLPQFAPDLVDYSATTGFSGLAGGWQYDLGGTYGHSSFDYNLRNTLNASLGPCLTASCTPGGIPNQTSFFAGRLDRGELSTGVNTSRTLNLGLAAPANLAIGATFRRETYQITRGELASYIDGGDTTQAGNDAPGGSQVFPGFAPTDESNSSRTNVGAYADLEANVTRALLANVAGRFEHYNDFGSLGTGKLALRLQASPRLTLRASASTGFRAPGLGQIHFSKVVTNVIAGTPEEIGVYPVDHAAAVALGARPLKQETSLNLSGGLAFTPAPNLTFTADYFYIKITDRILLGATFDDDTTRAILTSAGYPDIAGVQYFTNGLDTRTQGVDVNANLRLHSGRATTEFTAAVNFTKNEITRVDPLPAVLANSAETGLIDTVTWIGITQERPDWRATLTAQHSVGRFRALARGSYFGVFSSAQPGFCDLCRERYGAKTLFDAEIGYRIGNAELSLGARNLFNIYPDQPSSLVDVGGGTTSKEYNNNFGTFPWAAASPFGYNGRYVYARVSVGR